ncbi:MAG TPA: WYL domain-containing protein [Acidimicrobiales bacterium]|nr:WYL domain-containing protein [Acidimicrobiales bacterium]
MHRLERLINLVAALLHAERPLTTEELRNRLPGYAEDHGTFRRAFERDKEALRDLGIPVVVEPVDDAAHPGVVGYRIPKEAYYLQDPGLVPDELAALHLAASAVRLEGASGVEALWKLGGEVNELGSSGPLGGVAVPAPAVAALPGTAHLAPVFAAITARRPIDFAYRGRKRHVDPWRLSFRSGHWYLAGHDHDAGEERMFRLDRIESDVQPAGEEGAFERPAHAGSQPPPWELGGDDPLVARLLVDAGQAAWAAGHVGPEAVEEWRPDGSLVLAVRVTNRDAFRSFVLGFLEHAEVLGPPELRADMVEWLEAVCRS